MGRALVLGGGGVTGIAWEVGVLMGLLDEGLDLGADLVVGTSAGSFVGAAVASGSDLAELYAAQHEVAVAERTGVVSPELWAAWAAAYSHGGGDPVRVGQGFGRIAREWQPQVAAAHRREAVEARLVTMVFPEHLVVAVQDAGAGFVRGVRASDGLPLVDVVSASGAVPGLSPSVDLDDWVGIDGGMVSSTNVVLASGHQRMLVLAPLPEGHGGLPSASEELAALTGVTHAELVTPDMQSRVAIGANIYDPSRRSACAVQGRRQGRDVAGRIIAWW